MNKKFFLGMFAAAGMLLATSCSNDELDRVQSGNEAQVTFSLAAEGGIATRAISDGTGAKKLVYAVYNANGELIETIANTDVNGQIVDNSAFDNGLTENVTITLAKGQQYTVAFWAQHPECTAYTTTDLENVKVNYTGLNNDETRDAFFATETFKVNGNATINVTLKRPFAQINVGVTTEDWDAAVGSGVKITESKVVIKNAANSINLLDGSVDGEVAVEYDFATIPYQFTTPETLDVDTNGDGVKENYKYLSMSYILVNDANGGSSKATLESEGLQFTFSPESGNDILFFEGLNNVPVQRNWRTNIIGKILTGDVTFNITIDPIYDGEYNNGEVLGVKANNRYYETIIEAINAGATEIELAAGSWKIPAGDKINLQNKTLTFKGTKETVIDVSNIDERDQFVTGATLKFEGVTLNFGTALYMGFANYASLTYKDCAINGLQFAYGSGQTVFENCDLNSNGAEHCLWTWGGQNISFTDCDFTYGDRAVNCYGEGVKTYVSFTNCTFTKVAGATTTGAIETNSSTLTALYLTINNCTVNEGDLWWISTWDSKGGANTFATVDGKIATSAAMLAAIKDGATEVELLSGKYTMPTGSDVNLQNKTLTIKGTKETVIDVSNIDERDQFVTGATLKFEGVTLNFGTALYMGFANTKELTYKDCAINGVQHLYGPKVNFDGCTLNVAGDNYMVRTWGGKNVNFSNCTFNCDGKALLVYNQSCDLTITNCKFNDNGDDTISGKAAIEVCNGDNGDNCVTHNIIITNTTVSGFDINTAGINTNSTLWANKNSLDDAHLNVTIDGTVVY